MSSFTFSDCPTTVSLADGTRDGKTVSTGSLALTVRNVTPRGLTGTLSVQPDDMAQSGWFKIAGAAATSPAKRDIECEASATQTVTVNVAVPEGAPPGRKVFTLRVATERDPDNDFADSPTVAFEVKAPAPKAEPKKPFPWWIPAVAAVALVAAIIVGVVVWKFIPEDAQVVPAGLKGKLLPDAILALSDSDIDVDPEHFTAQMVAVAGKQNFEVVDVNPAEGMVLKAGQKLTLTVNTIPSAPPPPPRPCRRYGYLKLRFCTTAMQFVQPK